MTGIQYNLAHEKADPQRRKAVRSHSNFRDGKSYPDNEATGFLDGSLANRASDPQSHSKAHEDSDDHRQTEGMDEHDHRADRQGSECEPEDRRTRNQATRQQEDFRTSQEEKRTREQDRIRDSRTGVLFQTQRDVVLPAATGLAE